MRIIVGQDDGGRTGIAEKAAVHGIGEEADAAWPGTAERRYPGNSGLRITPDFASESIRQVPEGD